MLSLKLVIPDEIMQKIMWWIHKSNHEVSGFGSLDFDKESGTFTVRDAILLKQEVGPASTEIDPVSIGKAMYEMREEPNALKWHWHSHVDMGVFWSQDDRKLIENLGGQGWILASVFNKKREMKSAFYAKVESRFGEIETVQDQFLDDIPTHIQRFVDPSVADQWDKEYAEHVSVAKVITTMYDGYHYPSSNLLGFVKEAKRKTKKSKPKDHMGSYDYDDRGLKWSWKFERWAYNPVFDKALQTEAEILEAILTMDDEEVDTAYDYYGDRENTFKILYKKVLAEWSIGDDPEFVEIERSVSEAHLLSGSV